MEAKQLVVSTCIGLALFGMGAVPVAYAAEPEVGSTLRVIGAAPTTYSADKTRVQAREDLLVAWCDGTLQNDASDVNYPYSAESIDRARSLRAGKRIPGVDARCR